MIPAAWRRYAILAAENGVNIADPERYVTSCYNLASLAVEIGDQPLALDYFQRALVTGESRSLFGTAAYARLALADACMEYGRLSEARDAVLAVLRTGTSSPVLRIAIATAGIPVALVLDDEALLRRCDDPEALELAAASGESARFGPLASAYARLALSRNDEPTAQDLLSRALDMMTDVWSNLPTLLLLARLCSEDAVERAAALLNDAARRRPNDRVTAYRHLFTAYRAQRSGDAERRDGAARLASPILERIGARRPLAEGYELLQDAKTALALYRRDGVLRSIVAG